MLLEMVTGVKVGLRLGTLTGIAAESEHVEFRDKKKGRRQRRGKSYTRRDM